MQKIPTLFLRDTENKGRLTDEVNPKAAWLLYEPATATVKKDGVNVCVSTYSGGLLAVNKRRNPTKEGKAAGMQPYYVPADRDDPHDKHIFAAVDATDFTNWPDGNWPCEALGPKIQGGIESSEPCLYPFSLWPEPAPGEPLALMTEFAQISLPLALYHYLSMETIEGVVWHGENGKMAKIKRKDFNLPWPPK